MSDEKELVCNFPWRPFNELEVVRCCLTTGHGGCHGGLDSRRQIKLYVNRNNPAQMQLLWECHTDEEMWPDANLEDYLPTPPNVATGNVT
jgi:hypothetical protein